MSGEQIRRFFRELLGSRLTETLDIQLLQLRQDMDARLRDKDDIITSLKEERAVQEAKIVRYEEQIFSHASKLGADIVRSAKPVKPNFPNFDWSALPKVKTSWQIQQELHEQEMAEQEAAEKLQAQGA